jgi:hypothetical protein
MQGMKNYSEKDIGCVLGKDRGEAREVRERTAMPLITMTHFVHQPFVCFASFVCESASSTLSQHGCTTHVFAKDAVGSRLVCFVTKVSTVIIIIITE